MAKTTEEIEAEKESAKQEYRGHLLSLQQSMQGEYDKTVLFLSGGAFSVSAFIIKDFLGTKKVNMDWVVVSWILWSLSALSVLASYYCSALAMERAVVDVDLDRVDEKVGGVFNIWTRVLNAASGILFVAGLGAFTFFVAYYL